MREKKTLLDSISHLVRAGLLDEATAARCAEEDVLAELYDIGKPQNISIIWAHQRVVKVAVGEVDHPHVYFTSPAGMGLAIALSLSQNTAIRA